MIQYDSSDEIGADAPLSLMDARFRENAIAWRLGLAMGLWQRGDQKVAVDIDELVDLAEDSLRSVSQNWNFSNMIAVQKLGRS